MAVKGFRPDRHSLAGILSLETIKTRRDFLRAQKGERKFQPSLGLESCPTPPDLRRAGLARAGFTASRKVGGAVERNRAKRRLRAAAAAILPLYGREGRDYVLIARGATLTCPFVTLRDDLVRAIAYIHAATDKKPMLPTPDANERKP
jgi:ribonuclease P protein component